MTLATNVSELATRVGTELKSHKVLINGNAADLSALSTTDKSSLMAALNEVAGAVATAAGIDDASPSTTTTYSSTKTLAEIGTASTADRARANHSGTQSADTVVNGTTNKVFTATEQTKLAGIAASATANQTDAYLLDLANHTGSLTSAEISDFAAEVNALIEVVVDADGAAAALNTLSELSAALGGDADFAATITTALGKRVRVDAAQAFTGTEKTQARDNIGAQEAALIGDPATNYVTPFEAALI